jgi:hypothetical protein
MLGLPAEALVAVFGGLYAVLAVLNPRGALYLIPPAAALGPELPLGRLQVRPEDLMMVVLAAGWAVHRAGTPRTPTPLDRPLVSYAAVGVLATLWGALLGTADLWSTHPWTGAGLHALKRLELVLLFFILTDSVQSVEHARTLANVFLASLAGLSAYSLARFQESGALALGPAGAPVHEPGLAAMLTAGLCLGFLVGSRRPATSFASGGLLLASLYALPYSLGRNFMFATAAMLLVVGFSRKRGILLLLPIFLALAPYVFPPHVVARIESMRLAFVEVEYSEVFGAGVNLRQRIEPSLFYLSRSLPESPLLGWGLASVSLGSIDNEYALQLVTTGLLGFLVFLWLIVTLVRMLQQIVRAAEASGSSAFPLAAGLQYCLLGYGLYSLFSPSISAARAGAFFFLLVGLAAVLFRCVSESSPEAPVVRKVLGQPEFDPRRLDGIWSSAS